MAEFSITNYVGGCGFESLSNQLKLSDMMRVSSKEFLDIQAMKECRFILNGCVRWQSFLVFLLYF